MLNNNDEGDFSQPGQMRSVTAGTTVRSGQLTCCSMVLMRTNTNSILVQHCGGSDLDNLDEGFRPENNTDDEIIDIMIVSATPDSSQPHFAQTIQSWYPDANFSWYGFHDDSGTYPMPMIVTPGGPDEGFTLENIGRYDLLLSHAAPAEEEDQ